MSDKSECDEAEVARLRDEVVKRMLATPPQPKPKPAKKGADQSPRPTR
jgi:hypothetical protein